MGKTILKVSLAVVSADLTVLDRRFILICIDVLSSLFVNGSNWSFLSFWSLMLVLLQKPVKCQSCRAWILTDNFGNQKFGRNIATGKSCRIFLAPTSKMLPCAFSFSSSHVKLKIGHNLFLLDMRFSSAESHKLLQS